jgi:hypothetical protein
MLRVQLDAAKDQDHPQVTELFEALRSFEEMIKDICVEFKIDPEQENKSKGYEFLKKLTNNLVFDYVKQCDNGGKDEDED